MSPLGISLISLNSVCRGGGWAHGALGLPGGGFLLLMGIWPVVDVGAVAMRGKIPTCSILPRAGVDSGVWPHAPAVGSERQNTGGHVFSWRLVALRFCFGIGR